MTRSSILEYVEAIRRRYLSVSRREKGELLRRGAITALAPGNTPGFNILVTNGIDSMNVRVKTKKDAADSWVWNAKKDGTIFTDLKSRADFTVLVDLDN
jgi:hypothetical protein